MNLMNLHKLNCWRRGWGHFLGIIFCITFSDAVYSRRKENPYPICTLYSYVWRESVNTKLKEKGNSRLQAKHANLYPWPTLEFKETIFDGCLCPSKRERNYCLLCSSSVACHDCILTYKYIFFKPTWSFAPAETASCYEWFKVISGLAKIDNRRRQCTATHRVWKLLKTLGVIW